MQHQSFQVLSLRVEYIYRMIYRLGQLMQDTHIPASIGCG
jgi:hypothetical protein